jgi:hypothetical protein
MNSPNLSRAGIVIAVLLAVVSPGRAQWTVDSGGHASDATLLYQDRGVTFRYPTAWRRADKPNSVVFTADQSAIALYQVVGVRGPDALFVSYSKRLRNQSRNYVTEKRSVVTLAGYPARLLQFRAVSPAGMPSRGRLACLVSDNKGVVLVLTSPIGAFQKDSAAFAALLHSLQFTKAASPKTTTETASRLPGNTPSTLLNPAPSERDPTKSPTARNGDIPPDSTPGAGIAAAESLADGTEVKLKVNKKIDAKDAKKGDPLFLEVAEDVAGSDGKVIVAKGAKVDGHVLDAHSSRSFGRAGKLELAIECTYTPDGTRVPLRGNLTKNGRGGKAGAVATVLFMPLGGFYMKGRNPWIGEGKILTAFVDRSPRGEKKEEDGATPPDRTKSHESEPVPAPAPDIAPARIPTR